MDLHQRNYSWPSHLLLRFTAIMVLSCFLFSCKEHTQEHNDPNVYYTCSMDPQVMERNPGKCPICHMQLTRIEVTPGESNTIRLSAQQIQLGNIHVDTLRLQNVSQEKKLTGTTAINAKKQVIISSRVSGRITHLYIRANGEKISKGQKLYEIYSEDLITQQRNFLLSIEKKNALNSTGIDFGELIDAARNQLLLSGLTENQIESLRDSGNVQTSVPVYSSSGGTVITVNAHEGDYVKEGTSLFELVDLSSLWIEAQVYSNELDILHQTDYVLVQFAAYPGEIVKAHVDFENPELLPGSEVNLVRIEIPNSSGKYMPGMMAYIVLKGKNLKSFLLPANSVLHDKQDNWIWLRRTDGSFQARMVNTGITRNDSLEISSGVQEGELVVTSGAYLLNSEYTFRKNANPMAGMKM